MSVVAGAKTVTIHLTSPGERERGGWGREEDAKLANKIFAGKQKGLNGQNLIQKYAKKNL